MDKKNVFFFSCFLMFFFFPNKFENPVMKRLLCRDYREMVHNQAGPYNYRAYSFSSNFASFYMQLLKSIMTTIISRVGF